MSRLPDLPLELVSDILFQADTMWKTELTEPERYAKINAICESNSVMRLIVGRLVWESIDLDLRPYGLGVLKPETSKLLHNLEKKKDTRFTGQLVRSLKVDLTDGNDLEEFACIRLLTACKFVKSFRLCVDEPFPALNKALQSLSNLSSVSFQFLNDNLDGKDYTEFLRVIAPKLFTIKLIQGSPKYTMSAPKFPLLTALFCGSAFDNVHLMAQVASNAPNFRHLTIYRSQAGTGDYNVVMSKLLACVGGQIKTLALRCLKKGWALNEWVPVSPWSRITKASRKPDQFISSMAQCKALRSLEMDIVDLGSSVLSDLPETLVDLRIVTLIDKIM